MFPKLSNKIKTIWSGSLRMLGGAPRHYWGYWLVLWFLTLTAIFILDFTVFMKMRDSAFGEVYLPPNIGVKSVDRATLSAAAEILTNREKRFNDILMAPTPRDPGK